MGLYALYDSLNLAYHPYGHFPTSGSPAPAVLPPADLPISPSTYAAALDVRVPLTIASVYAVTAHLLNARSNGKPYAIAKTRPFRFFVILHNIFLAVYSAWTFVGMTRGIHRAIDRRNVVGSLCRIREGTRSAIGLIPREGLWEDALAWYGWWFYLSKFYEVVDTAIIIAKGRKSSLLQTYHHAGAMLCMWGGIRYMAAPIWVFCVFNSLIHSLMYTYYTLSTLHLKVPVALKQALTTLQITQFIVGGSFAALHLFMNVTPSVPCLSNEGEVLAVFMNCIYLAPLTYLFVRFFVNSYTSRGRNARKAITSAANGVVEGKGSAAFVSGHRTPTLANGSGRLDTY